MKKYGEFLSRLLLVALAAFVVFNFSSVGGFLQKVRSSLQPVVVGVVLALAMSVPLRFFKTGVFKKVKKEKLNEIFSLACTFLLFAGVITLLGALILPQGVRSVRDVAETLAAGGVENAIDNVSFLLPFKPFLLKAYAFFSGKISTYLPQILDALRSVVTGVYNVLFGMVIAVMLVVGRKAVKEQLKKGVDLLFKEKYAKVRSFLHAALKKFSGYLGGQLTEAFILGFACYLVTSLLKIPFAALVSLIVGFMNLIPVIGAYVAGIVCTVLVFSVDPTKAFVLLAALLILQQVENFTTYPVVVGKYVGLNGFWTTTSVLVFGGIFGFWGMFFGVPVTAFAFEIFETYYKKKKAETALLPSLRK